MRKITAQESRNISESDGLDILSLKSQKKLDKIHRAIEKESYLGRHYITVGFWFGDIQRYCLDQLEREGYFVNRASSTSWNIKW